MIFLYFCQFSVLFMRYRLLIASERALNTTARSSDICTNAGIQVLQCHHTTCRGRPVISCSDRENRRRTVIILEHYILDRFAADTDLRCPVPPRRFMCIIVALTRQPGAKWHTPEACLAAVVFTVHAAAHISQLSLRWSSWEPDSSAMQNLKQLERENEI